MTEPIRRPVSQLRAGDLIALDDEGTALVVCAVSQPLGAGRRVELADAATGRPVPWVRLDLHEAVLTLPGRARWVVATDRDGHTESLLTGDDFEAPASDGRSYASWTVEVDPLSRPGWEELRRGPRHDAASAA
ncbi:MAG: hypothetical protein ABWX60_10205 [Aeromicrobium sp.]